LKRAIDRQSGFTLLELILSLAVVVVLAAVCLVGIRLALASRDAGTQKADSYQRLRILHEQMNRTIRSAYLVMIPKPSNSLIEEDEHTKAKATRILAFEGKPDSLKFVTFSSPLTGTGPAPWIHQIHIYLEQDDLTGTSRILMEEQKFSPETFLEKADDDDASLQVMTLAQDVAFLEFRYYQPSAPKKETEDDKKITAADPTGEWVKEILPESFEFKDLKQTAEEEDAEQKNLSLPKMIEVSAGLWEPPKENREPGTITKHSNRSINITSKDTDLNFF